MNAALIEVVAAADTIVDETALEVRLSRTALVAVDVDGDYENTRDCCHLSLSYSTADRKESSGA